MSSNTIIVDERDARISYTGLWASNGSSSDYLRTSYSSNVNGATMTFQFTGSSMSLVGNFEPGGTCTASFSMDGSSNSFTSPAASVRQRQRTLYTSSQLSEGPHTFVYTVGTCQSSNVSTSSGSPSYITVDHILYTAQDPPKDGSVFFVDDRDPSIAYSGTWTETAADGNFQQTSKGGGQGSSLTYAFNGTGIGVYGSLMTAGTSSNVQASFSVDGGAPLQYTAGPQNSSNVEFWSTKDLAAGMHTLKVSADGDSPLWVDYLLVNPGGSSNSTSQRTSEGGKNDVPLGPIIGGSVGGAVLLIGALLIFYCVNKRRKALKAPSERYKNSQSWRGGPTSDKERHISYATSSASLFSKGGGTMATAASISSSTAQSRRGSRVGKPPSLPSSRPVLYSPLDEASPGFSASSQSSGPYSGSRAVGGYHSDDDNERAPLSPPDANPATHSVYPPTPPYITASFDINGHGNTGSRPTSPARSTQTQRQPSSPSYTTTTFDQSEYGGGGSGSMQRHTRIPSYSTTAPESSIIHAHYANSAYTASPTHTPAALPLSLPPSPSHTTTTFEERRGRRASLTPTYITTVPESSTIAISPFLPAHVESARAYQQGHGRIPSYATTAPYDFSGEVPPVPALPSRVPTSPERHEKMPPTPSRRSSAAHSTTSALTGVGSLRSFSSPRALPTPPTPPSQPLPHRQLTNPSPKSRAGSLPREPPVDPDSPAELKRQMALRDQQSEAASGISNDSGRRLDVRVDPIPSSRPPAEQVASPGEPPPQYTYRF